MDDASHAAGPFHLRASGVVCARGERVLFAPVDLTLDAGDIVWLRGANGSGKTTLLRTLAGLAAPASGRIEWPASARPAHLFLGHANALKDDLTAVESLAFLASLAGIDAGRPALAAALEAVGLGRRAAAPVRFLSQGQRRRVALARLALAGVARTWLLDEPFDALDRDGVALLEALLGSHAAHGGSVLLTSHVPPTIVSPVPRVVDLAPGAAAPAAAVAAAG